MKRLTSLAVDALGSDPTPAPAQPGAMRGLAAVETAIRAAMTSLGASLLEQLLATDPGHAGPRIDCGAGHRAGFVAYRGKTLDTVLGPIRLRRAWYHCQQCGHGQAPLDDRLAVTGQSLTPGLRAMLDRVGAAAPFTPATKLLTDLTGIDLTVKRVERAAEADGTAAETKLRADTQAILTHQVIPLPPAEPIPDKLYLAIDGTGVPITAAETQDRAGKGADGRARTRETKLAALFTQTRLDDDGHPIRDPDSTSYAATLQPVGVFTNLVTAEARRRGADHIRQLVVLGDGAHWIWNLANTCFPEATQIVDLYHAREHLHDLADHLGFLHSDPHRWLADRLTELDNGDIEAIVAAAHAYRLTGNLAAQRAKDLAYLQTNTHRMRYAHYRKLGLFVGSGVVEAGCKTVIGARLKQSGMCCNSSGATAINTLRCQQASIA